MAEFGRESASPRPFSNGRRAAARGLILACGNRHRLRVPAMKTNSIVLRSVCLSFVPLLASGCGGSGGAPAAVATRHFVTVRSDPANGARIHLNDEFRVDFSTEIDPTTMDLGAVAFSVFDLDGNALAEQPSGRFTVGTAADDAAPGRRLVFAPVFPSDDEYGNGGFRPARRYVVNLLGADRANGSVLTDTRGNTLERSATFEFTTVAGTTAGELFRDTRPGGPRRRDFAVTPNRDGVAELGLRGRMPVEVRLGFDQPLDPASTNLPVAFDTDPARRAIGKRGRIWLEYDDPAGKGTWIPTAFEVTENALSGAVVTLRPLGVLPNHATIRVMVSPELRDMAGESNVGASGYDPVFATFATDAGYEPRFDALVERFDTTVHLDPDAPFVEARAESGPGFLRAGFEFEGTPTTLDYEPTAREVFLNTDFTQIVPKGAPPINVSGGVFQFRNVRIPQGVVVRGTGTRPMVWLVTGDFTVEGELTVSGGDGERVNTLNSPNYPSAGGIGSCGGGNGGRGSVNAVGPTYPATESGFGPGQVRDGGGKGGRMSCQSACGVGSGGGGGAFATQGDPDFKVAKPAVPATGFVQVLGQGGYGCTGPMGRSTLPGGAAGPVAFSDARKDNDFWGSAVNLQRQVRIRGELARPQGGAGGGGGGDRSFYSVCSANHPQWTMDEKGGGGGAGGGVIVVKALGTIAIGPSGAIRADGGHGNGGEQAGSNNRGGGGGGGSGGMVVLMAGRKIRIDVHGETYTSNDFAFAISADGGISKKGSFSNVEIVGKYDALHPVNVWDASPTGGFGGSGVVQLMAPAGDNSVDGTNTVLDDNIEFRKNGTTLLTGAEKRRYLAWRGFPNESGVLVDDNGVPTAIGRAEGGDIRPCPVLLPAPFGSRSRARSRWLDTGVTQRRELAGADGLPRGVVPRTNPEGTFGAGPVYSFGGTFTSHDAKLGFARYDATGSALETVTLVPATPVTAFDANARLDSAPVLAVTLARPVLGDLADRWAQRRCELLDDASGVVGGFRVLAHDARTLLLAADGSAWPVRERVRAARIVDRCFDVVTGKSPGLGGSATVGAAQVPLANLRIGFAFHVDPSRALTSGSDPLRFPQQVGTFVHDLADPAVASATRGKGFVQWEVLFDMLFAESQGAPSPRALAPDLPRPELRWLVIPYRF